MKWFGDPWHAPVCEPAEHVETPVGQPCLYCGEHIEEGDQGVVAPHVGLEGVSYKPQHLECFMRQITGGLNHIAGRCTCCPGGTEPPDPPSLTRREAAILAERAWQIRNGLPGR